MPRASAAPARRRAGGFATAFMLVTLLAAGGTAAAADPPTDDFAPDRVQADAIPNAPYGMAIGDRNGDGRPDAFIARWSSGDVLIRQGTEVAPGGGRMDDDVVVPTGGHPREVVAVRWDRDRLDDAVTLLEGQGVSVWTGGLGTAQLAIPDALTVATGDVDGDGDVDAVVARYREGEPNLPVQVVRNETLVDGAPLLSRGDEISVCDQPRDVQLADVIGDGALDLLIVCQPAGTVQVRPGNGSGRFGPAVVSSSAGALPYRLAIGDLDGDSVVDLAVTGASAVRILRGLGGGSFGTPTSYATAGRPRRPLLVDIDGDGRLDLATTWTTERDGNGIGYRFARDDGTFGTERRIAWTADAWDVRAADVTRDGRLDLVAIAWESDGFGVWEGRAAPDPIVELSGLGVGVYEGAAGVALDAGARILGPSAAPPTAMTVEIASGRGPGDVLTAALAAPFSFVRDETTGALTISSALPQPIAAWRAALRTVRFAHVAGAAGGARAGRRAVRVQLDGLPTATRSIDVWLRPPDAGELRLTGVPVTGETLTLDAGPWGGTPPIALRTTLERCAAGGARCVGLATDLPYVLRRADLAATLRVRMVGTGPDGTSATTFSARTAPIHVLAAPELLGGPGAETADTAVELAFRGEEGATFACTVDGGAQAPCVSPLRVAGLAAGAHAIGVVQVLPSGARSAAAVRAFAVRPSVEPPPVTVTTTTPPPPPVTVTTTTPAPPPEQPPTTPVDPPSAPPRPALVVPRRATGAQLRRGLVVQVQHVAKGAKTTATLQSGKRRVVATSRRAARGGTLQLRLRAASGAVARLGRSGTLGLAVTVAAPGAKRVTLAARIAYRR